MYGDTQGGTVSFNCRNGEQRSYHYSMPDFLEIVGGADPASFTPDGEGGGDGFAEALEEVQAAGAGDAGAATAGIGEAVIDIGLL